MDLENIKRGLRAEIKKRENEQYLTFQCNVRQMCKDVLAKLEEQESEIAELKQEIERFNKENESLKKTLQHSEDELESYLIFEKEIKQELRRHKYKRCLAMAKWCHSESLWWYSKGYGFEKYDKFWEKWEKRWLELAEK